MSKRNYYQSQLSSNSHDPRKTRKLKNSLIKGKEKGLTPPDEQINPVNQQPTNDPTHMASIFNDYFVSIGNRLAIAIISPANKKYPVSCHGPQRSFVLHEATSEEVKIIINNLRVSKSVRMNDIPIHILKICKQILSPFLAQLFNRCVKSGIYSECLKCAQAIPIHKGGRKNHCTNYRPISLLSPFNTIFEKLIYTRLYSYVEQNKMLSDSQYGFRSGLSTSVAIYDIHENLFKNREEKYTTCAIFCDVSKAFDTIDHNMLLHKLEHFYGIRGIPLKLLTNYLQDRQQYTVVE